MSQVRDRQVLRIESSGKIVAVYDDCLVGLIEQGDLKIQRATHIEPGPGGGWLTDLSPVGGSLLGPFRLRSEALDAERIWLNENLIKGDQNNV